MVVCTFPVFWFGDKTGENEISIYLKVKSFSSCSFDVRVILTGVNRGRRNIN